MAKTSNRVTAGNCLTRIASPASWIGGGLGCILIATATVLAIVHDGCRTGMAFWVILFALCGLGSTLLFCIYTKSSGRVTGTTGFITWNIGGGAAVGTAFMIVAFVIATRTATPLPFGKAFRPTFEGTQNCSWRLVRLKSIPEDRCRVVPYHYDETDDRVEYIYVGFEYTSEEVSAQITLGSKTCHFKFTPQTPDSVRLLFSPNESEKGK